MPLAPATFNDFLSGFTKIRVRTPARMADMAATDAIEMVLPVCHLFLRGAPDVAAALQPPARAVAYIRKYFPTSETLLLEPRSVYDEGIIGVTTVQNCDHWTRTKPYPLIIYDPELCIQSKVRHGMYCDFGGQMGAYAAAADAFYYNRDAWTGVGTPTFIDNWDEGLVARVVRERLQFLRRQLYRYTRAVGFVTRWYKRAKARVNFAPGGVGAQEAAAEFAVAASAAAPGEPPMKRARVAGIAQFAGKAYKLE